ncbi:hypothetical protein K4F52_001336 [Lecanicillium sp. MT-2017a]|nr:hypothetical protein K4F52_001336 [Lecanicillium sp. MT-2017a]
MKYSFSALALAGMASAAAVNTNASPVSVSLSSMGDTTVKAVITNNGDKDYNIMHKGTILDSVPVNKFQVTKGADTASFHGIKVRMGTTGFHEDDFTALSPGESKEVVVDLASIYGLDKSGAYDVSASGRFRVAEAGSTELVRGAGVRFSSNSVKINVDGHKASQVTKAIHESLASRSTIDSDCTASQKTTVQDGIDKCKAQANAAADAAVNGSASKFKEYFMSTATKDRSYVADRFKAVAKECGATDGGVLTVHCKDTYGYCRSNDFAYTVSDDDTVVWCNEYYNAPLETSTCHGDDKTGTTIHEFTHASSVFDPPTEDHAYGYDDCVALDRAEALENADTYEYYANAIHLDC